MTQQNQNPMGNKGSSSQGSGRGVGSQSPHTGSTSSQQPQTGRGRMDENESNRMQNEGNPSNQQQQQQSGMGTTGSRSGNRQNSPDQSKR